MKKTVVLGATDNPSRFAYAATQRLMNANHDVIPIGVREGEVNGLPIRVGEPELKDVDTITLYLNPKRQEQYYDYILSLQPKRIIFNPGTENPELMRLAMQHDIETEVGCTLVMLSVGTY